MFRKNSRSYSSVLGLHDTEVKRFYRRDPGCNLLYLRTLVIGTVQ